MGSLHLHLVKEQNKAYFIAFGKHLEQMMQEREIDAQTVAAHGKIEPKQVYRVLNAEHGASLGTILSIARGMGVHPKELFDFDFEFTSD